MWKHGGVIDARHKRCTCALNCRRGDFRLCLSAPACRRPLARVSPHQVAKWSRDARAGLALLARREYTNAKRALKGLVASPGGPAAAAPALLAALAQCHLALKEPEDAAARASDSLGAKASTKQAATRGQKKQHAYARAREWRASRCLIACFSNIGRPWPRVACF
jgi:hypothetical protein